MAKLGHLGHIRIKAPHFVAGIVWTHMLCGVQVTAAPIIKYMANWTPIKIRRYCEQRGWECTIYFGTTESDKEAKKSMAKKQGHELSSQQAIQREATIEVTQTVLGQVRTTLKKKIKIRPFVTATATVGVKYGATVNTGNFENVKVDVFISAPSYVEEMVSVFNQCCAMGDKLMTRETDKILKAKER